MFSEEFKQRWNIVGDTPVGWEVPTGTPVGIQNYTPRSGYRISTVIAQSQDGIRECVKFVCVDRTDFKWATPHKEKLEKLEFFPQSDDLDAPLVAEYTTADSPVVTPDGWAITKFTEVATVWQSKEKFSIKGDLVWTSLGEDGRIFEVSWNWVRPS